MKSGYVIGYGEVGKAIYSFLCEKNPFVGLLSVSTDSLHHPITADVLHICFPYSENFTAEVKRYQLMLDAKLTIIHSTVPIGTSRKCNAVHSPIRGVHPHLEKSLTTFVKYFGGKGAEEASKYFKGIKTKCFEKSETTEALKLWSTTQYAWSILLQKEIHAFCQKNKLSFDDVYTEPNNTYNEGYASMGMNFVNRPVLKHKKGKIGGHCLISNARLFQNFITQTILKKNDEW